MRLVSDGRGRESYSGGSKSLNRSLWSGKALLRALDVLQGGSRTSVQELTTSARPWGCQHMFRQIGRKMNLSARVAFGNGHLAPKHVYFTFPQSDSLRKSSRSSGGKKRMMFSLRCRLGIIRGRTTGKVWAINAWGFFCLNLSSPKILQNIFLSAFYWIGFFWGGFLFFLPNLHFSICTTRWSRGQLILGAD